MTNLRQCFNSMTVIGTLKSKEVKFGTTANGDSSISLNLVLVSNDGDKIHENRINLWAKNTSKLYNGYLTASNEYKTIDQDGENADRLKITGSLEMNEYFNTTAGEIKTYNNTRGVFINRLDKDLQDEAGAVVEGIITNMIDEISKEGTLTGRKKVGFITIGYQGAIHEIQNMVVEKELAQQFAQLYPIGSTGKLFLKINNYSVKSEEQPVPTVGFGSTLSNMPDTVVKDYTNEIVIIGGDTPNIANKFTPEQVAEALKQRELSKAEKMGNAPATPPANSAPSGFGTGFANNTGETINDGALPF